MVEVFDVVVFVCVVVVLDVDVVFFYCGDEYCVCYGVVDWCCVEVCDVGGCDVECVVL